jgi:hypothetical protein
VSVVGVQIVLELKEWSLPAHLCKRYMVVDNDGKTYIGSYSRAAACLSTLLKLMRPRRWNF